MNQPRIAIGLALASLAVASQTGCRSAGLSRQLEGILARQTEQWNRGSIEGFMRYYVHSDELTFSSGGELRRGWDATSARYKSRYPDRAAMGSLSFTDLETMLANMEKVRGMYFSQPVLLALTEAGVSRDEAYAQVQRCAMRVWDEGVPLREALAQDHDITGKLDDAVIDRCFDLQHQLRNLPHIFERTLALRDW